MSYFASSALDDFIRLWSLSVAYAAVDAILVFPALGIVYSSILLCKYVSCSVSLVTFYLYTNEQDDNCAKP